MATVSQNVVDTDGGQRSEPGGTGRTMEQWESLKLRWEKHTGHPVQMGDFVDELILDSLDRLESVYQLRRGRKPKAKTEVIGQEPEQIQP